MMHRRTLTVLVSIALLLLVMVTALLWPYQSEVTPDVEIERDVPEEIPATYQPEEAGFAVEVQDIVTPYRIMSTFVLPGEAVEIEVLLPDQSTKYTLDASQGSVLPTGSGQWIWQAPNTPGLYRLHIDERASSATMTLNAFVKTPYDIDEGILNGYRIGRYEAKPLRNDPAYDPPEGLIEVTPELKETLVSPHFTLGQFLCKQESKFPKYVLLREQLLLKLERLLREINERGIETPSLHVMSAYRTPFYNRSIGNRTSYSRHLYGGAADIYVDVDDDNYMDDVNDDGQVTRADADFLAEIVEDQQNEPWYRPLVGGLGIYSPAPHRGPFIHVDVRGQPVRW